jgi:hypothetical protein
MAPFGVGAESMAWLPKIALRDPLGRVPSALWIGAVACSLRVVWRVRKSDRSCLHSVLLGSGEVGWVSRTPPHRRPLMFYPYKPLLVTVDVSSADLLRALEKMLDVAGLALSSDELSEALTLRLQIMLVHHRNDRARAAP